MTTVFQFIISTLFLGTVLLTCDQKAASDKKEAETTFTPAPGTPETPKPPVPPAADKPATVVPGDMPVADGHTTESSVDWNGTYKGVVPCDDCSGIDIVLTLNMNKTYKLNAKYRDSRKEYNFENKFSFDNTGGNVILQGMGNPPAGLFNKFKVGENIAWMLDAAGNKVGAKAYNSFALNKQ